MEQIITIVATCNVSCLCFKSYTTDAYTIEGGCIGKVLSIFGWYSKNKVIEYLILYSNLVT